MTEQSQVNPMLEEIEHWQAIYDWLRQTNGFAKEADHVEIILRKFILSIKVNPNLNPGPSQ